MQILEIRFFHVRKGPNIGPEPHFHDPRTSNVGYYPRQPHVGPLLTLRYMAAPLQNSNFENPFFFHVRRGPNIGIKSNLQGPMTSNG